MAGNPINNMDDYTYSKKNIYRSPGDVAVSMGQLYYYQVADLMRQLDMSQFYEDVFMSKRVFMILFGKVQPTLQRRKIKYVPDGQTKEIEIRMIDYFRYKITLLNDTLNPVMPFVVRTPGYIGYKLRKGYSTDTLRRINLANEILNELVWRLYFSIHSVGMLLPKTDDPATSLTGSPG